MSDRIIIGDVVAVYFNDGAAILDAEIIETPYATGDCFTLKDKDGFVYNVQQYNYMVKKPLPAPEGE